MSLLLRWRMLLAGLWLGLVLVLAVVVAPTAFAVLPRTEAGQVAGALFRIEAPLSMGLALLLFMLERRCAAWRADPRAARPVSANTLMILAVLFCTVLGYYGMQPLMEAARAGQGRFSFGQLHAVSSAFYALKGLLLAALAWRATASNDQAL